jgi:lipopolysaccharide/colanic/teichoic acid biosynthesis glycosyltransferase
VLALTHSMYLSTKSGLILAERFLAALMLFAFWGAVASIALFIWITGGKPIILTDEWVAKEGTPARAYRFRTAGPGLPIFRFVGRVLRQYSLDEIPSLWNVACGEVRLGELSPFKYR